MARLRLTLVVLASLAAAGPAGAHAFLKTSTPAVGSTVKQAPPELVINFTEAVEPSFCTITVQDAAGASVDTGSLHGADGNRQLAVGLKPLQPGAYTVNWHATAVDTHKTQGNFTFTVAN